MLRPVIMLKYPIQSIQDLVEKVQGTVKAKVEVKVNKVLGLPVNAQKIPIICLRHERPRTQLLYNADSIIDAHILEGVGILGDMVIYAVPFWVGEVINGSPLSGVFFRNHAYGVTLKIGKCDGRRVGSGRDGVDSQRSCLSQSRLWQGGEASCWGPDWGIRPAGGRGWNTRNNGA
ncbi:hypothetical protein ACROYT_G014072 [Oculina patagonica]